MSRPFLRASVCSIVFTMAILGLSGCEFGMNRYESQEYGFSVSLPRGWEKIEKFQDTVIMARAIEKDPKYHTNITITMGNLTRETERMSRKIMLAEFFEANKAQIMAVLPGTKYNVQEGEVMAGKDKGMTLSFKYDVQSLTLRFFIAVWMRGSRVYTITCSTEADKYIRYQPIFLKVFQSLRIK